MFLVQSSNDLPVCPKCSGRLKYRDSRPRIFRRDGGHTDHLLIRRLRCDKCRTYHNELPDCIAPFKHYETEVISGVIAGIVTSDDLDSEDHPSARTMHHWLYWFHMNRANIEGHLRNTASTLLGLGEEILFSGSSLLETIQTQYQDWLEKILRIIYNSGGFLPAIPW